MIKVGRRGKMKEVKEKCIDVVEDKKQEMNGMFKISHSKAVSETFIPHLFEDKVNDIVYADIAGL